MKPKKFTIYGLTEPGTGTIRYVGSTCDSLAHRLRLHLCDPRSEALRTWLEALAPKKPGIIALEYRTGTRLATAAGAS